MSKIGSVQSLGNRFERTKKIETITIINGLDVPFWAVTRTDYNTDPELALMSGGEELRTTKVVGIHLSQQAADEQSIQLSTEDAYKNEHSTSYEPGVYYEGRSYHVVGPMIGSLAVSEKF
jgi:hypothetical protein